MSTSDKVSHTTVLKIDGAAAVVAIAAEMDARGWQVGGTIPATGWVITHESETVWTVHGPDTRDEPEPSE